MADATTLTRRSALEGHYSAGDFGAIKDGTPGITLQERRALAIVHVDAWDDKATECAGAVEAACGTAPASANSKASEANGTAVLWVGPGRWLVTEAEKRDLPALITDFIGDLGVVTDHSHSRVCWRLSGPDLRALLAKGSTVDFDRFGDGDCLGTLLGHFTVTIQGRGEDSADLYGARSFAVDLQDWLVESGLKPGDRVAVVDDGRLLELGPHDDLVAGGGTYAELYDAWTRGLAGADRES